MTSPNRLMQESYCNTYTSSLCLCSNIWDDRELLQLVHSIWWAVAVRTSFFYWTKWYIFPCSFFSTRPSLVFYVDMKSAIRLLHYSISNHLKIATFNPSLFLGFLFIFTCLFRSHHHSLLIIEALWYIFISGKANAPY